MITEFEFMIEEWGQSKSQSQILTGTCLGKLKIRAICYFRAGLPRANNPHRCISLEKRRGGVEWVVVTGLVNLVRGINDRRKKKKKKKLFPGLSDVVLSILHLLLTNRGQKLTSALHHKKNSIFSGYLRFSLRNRWSFSIPPPTIFDLSTSSSLLTLCNCRPSLLTPSVATYEDDVMTVPMRRSAILSAFGVQLHLVRRKHTNPINLGHLRRARVNVCRPIHSCGDRRISEGKWNPGE